MSGIYPVTMTKPCQPPLWNAPNSPVFNADELEPEQLKLAMELYIAHTLNAYREEGLSTRRARQKLMHDVCRTARTREGRRVRLIHRDYVGDIRRLAQRLPQAAAHTHWRLETENDE